jgi:hypothetical protein
MLIDARDKHKTLTPIEIEFDQEWLVLAQATATVSLELWH